MKRVIVTLLMAVALCLAALPAHSAVPAAPQLYYTTNGLDLSVQWAEVPGATSYTLYYAPHPFTGDGIGSFSMGAETHLDVSLWEGAAYYVAVVANNGEGSSGLSNIQQFVTSTVIPSAPQLIYDPSGTRVTISWDSSARATGYRLSFMPSAYTVPWEFMSLDMGGQTSFSYDHLQVGGTYTIAVQAYNAHGMSGYSNIETFTVPDPQPPRYVTVAGPAGVTLETPMNTPIGASTVSLKAVMAGETVGLVIGGEALASPVFGVEVEGGGTTRNGATSTLSIPVDPAYRSNPDKLIVRMKDATKRIPIVGWYDAATGSYQVQVNDFTDGSRIALVHNPLQVIYRALPAGGVAQLRVAPMNGQLYDWEPVVDNPALVIPGELELIIGFLKRYEEVYANAGFKLPKLARSKVSSKKILIIETNGAESIGYDYTTDEIVINVVAARRLQQQDMNYSYDMLAAHELFHAVQNAYDVRADQGNWRYYKDGTATTVGATAVYANSIMGPNVFMRTLVSSPQITKIDQAIDIEGDEYSKQDYFAYLAKKYKGGSFAYLHPLFNKMHDLTASARWADSSYLLRSAMKKSFKDHFNATLAEAYFGFVEDRAYRHTDSAILRSVDESLEQMTLDKSIFETAYIDQLETYRSGNDVWRTIDLIPLQSKFVQIELPHVAEEVKLPLKFKVTGGELGAEQLKVLVFRDGSGAEPVTVTTLDEPTLVPVDSVTTSLTVLAMNGYVSPNRSEISISIAKPEIVSVSPENPRPGDQVTITGKLFGERVVSGYSKVWLNDNEVEPVSWTDTEIRFTLPPMGQEGTLNQNTIYIENLAGVSNEIDFNVNILGVSSLTISWETRIEYGLPGEINGVDEERASLSLTLPNLEILPYNPADWLPICANGYICEIPVFFANNVIDSGFTPTTANVSVIEHRLVDGILKPTYRCSVGDSSSRLTVVRGISKNPAEKEYLLDTSSTLIIPLGHRCEQWVENDNGTGYWQGVTSYRSYGHEADRYLRGEESKLFFADGAALEDFLANPRGSRNFNFSPVIDETSADGYTHSVTRFNVDLNLVVPQ